MALFSAPFAIQRSSGQGMHSDRRVDHLIHQSNVVAVTVLRPTASIRPATIHDLPGAYRVCLQTGNSGADATDDFRDPDLLGQVYVGPYIVGAPDLAFVVTDDQGVAGYTFGVNDTNEFEAWAEQEWWPALREQHPSIPGDSADAEIIRMLYTRPPSDPGVLEIYPAHLHIDLLPRVHGQGFGRALIERLLAALRDNRARGVHLGVGANNINAIEFYRHLGFTTLAKHPDAEVMGLVL